MALHHCNTPGCADFLEGVTLGEIRAGLPFVVDGARVPDSTVRPRVTVSLKKKSPISVHQDSNNMRTYVRTQHGRNSWEIAEAVTPYVGRFCTANINNEFGHGHRYRVWLSAVKGNKVVLQLQGEHFPKVVVISAWEAFADECTTFEPDDADKSELLYLYGM